MGNLYTKLKIFHYQEKIDSLPKSIDKILPPVHVRIKPTNICNHSCWYCAYRTDKLQLGHNMLENNFISKKKMMEIIDDVIDMGVKSVTFSGGGDPFCYPYLLDTAMKLARSSVKFASLTNGSLLYGEIAEVFAHNAQWIRISMDGWNDESYASYRSVSNNEFGKIMTNIRNFNRYKAKCHLGICIIVDKKNASHLYNFVKKLKVLGVNSVKIAPCIISDNDEENNKYHKPLFGFVKEQIAKALTNLSDKEFEIFDSYHEQLATFKKEYTWCPYIQIHPVIGADLNIYSCQDKAYNLDCGLIGSIKGTRFKDFWFTDKSKFFRIDPSRVCGHHCVSNEKNEFLHEYLSVDPGHLEFV